MPSFQKMANGDRLNWLTNSLVYLQLILSKLNFFAKLRSLEKISYTVFTDPNLFHSSKIIALDFLHVG